jgi:hypothetical protein
MRRSTYRFCHGDRAAVLTSWIPMAWAWLENTTPIDRIAVAQQVSWDSLPGERLHDLLGRPLSRGGLGDVDVDDASPVVRQDHEDEQDLEQHGGHDEDVHGDQAPEVVVEKGAPRLRGWPSMVDRVLGDRGLRDLDAQLLQLPVNPRRPQRGLALDMRRISARTSRETGGRPRPVRRLFQFQNSLNPVRCHRITVSGLTTETASAQPVHTRHRRTQIR